MLKNSLLLAVVLSFSLVPAVYGDSVNSTINTPGGGYSLTDPRENDVRFSESALESWHGIQSIRAPNIQPVFFPVLILIIFGLSFSAGLKAKDQATSAIFLVLSFLMALVLILLFSGNMEYGLLQEETASSINTSTGIFEISKTYHSTKIIPHDETFRPIFAGVFYMLFFVSVILLIVKCVLIPVQIKKRKEKEDQEKNNH